MVCEYEKISALHKMPEVMYGQVDYQELSVKCAVPGVAFWRNRYN